MAIDWMVLSYFVIGLFALSGFFKGWWKEAITTIFLALLVFLLQIPDVAQIFIDLINLVFATIADILPPSVNRALLDMLEINLGIQTVNDALQIDYSDGGTWVTILILFVGASIFISRFLLPNWDRARGSYDKYVVTWTGSVLGGLVGGLNGLLVISLVREYLDGRNLPRATFGSEIAAAGGGQTFGVMPSQAAITATELPNVTILDSVLPWIFIVIGIFLVLSAMKNRLNLVKSKDGYRKVEFTAPLGYEKRDVTGKVN